MANLFEMTQQAKALYAMLQTEEIDEQTFADTLEAIGAEDKIEGYCQVIKQLQADEEMFAQEAKRIAARKQTISNSIERMKSALKEFLLSTGQNKAKAGTFSVNISSRESVNVFDVSRIPPIYINLQPQPDKRAIKEAIENGEKIDGAEIVSKHSIAIR